MLYYKEIGFSAHKEKERKKKIAQQNNQPNFADQIQWFYVLSWNTIAWYWRKKLKLEKK